MTTLPVRIATDSTGRLYRNRELVRCRDEHGCIRWSFNKFKAEVLWVVLAGGVIGLGKTMLFR